MFSLSQCRHEDYIPKEDWVTVPCNLLTDLFYEKGVVKKPSMWPRRQNVSQNIKVECIIKKYIFQDRVKSLQLLKRETKAAEEKLQEIKEKSKMREES